MMGVEVRAIRESEFEECLDLWELRVFGGSRAAFERYFRGDPEFQPEYCRVAVVDGRLASAVHVCRRVVACGEATLTMGGVANVATMPEYRGRGLNTACLRQAIAVMEADAMDFSLLGTGIPGFYARLGWETVAFGILDGPIRAGLAPAPSKVVVRPYEARDDAAVRALYAQFNRARPIAVRREDPYWRAWIGWRGGRAPGEARVAARDGAVVAYSLHRFHEDRVEVCEIGAADGAEEALGALLDGAVAEGLRRGLRRAQFSLPAVPAVRAAAERLCAPVERHAQTGGMARLLQREDLLRGLAPELTDRWRRAGAPPGGLTFDTPYGAVRIEPDGGLLRVLPTDDRRGALPQADLFALLIGTEPTAGRLDERDARFASALFPRFDAWYWPLDEF